VAIYHCSVKPISRSGGRSATAAAAYRAAAEIADQRTGELHDYRRRRGVVHVELCAPEQAPAWSQDRAVLWNRAEAAEKRKDARVAREIEVSLPHEIAPQARLELARSYARDLVSRYGVAVDMAIHAPHRKGDERNHHVHYLLTTRALESGGFSSGKADLELSNTDRKKRGLSSCEAALKEERGRWAQHVNRELERAGITERVDHRSFEERGIERQPTQHMGPKATQMDRKGKETRIGRENREIEIWNRDRAEADWQLQVIEAAIEGEKKRLAREKSKSAARGSAGAARRGFRKSAPSPADQERANSSRAAMQSRQLDETREFEGRQDRERSNLERGLDDFYGADLKKQREELQVLEEALQRRMTRRRREEAEARAGELRRTIESARQRMEEQRGGLDGRQEAEKARQQARQAKERQDLEQRLERGPEPPAVNDNREQLSPEEERARRIEEIKARMRVGRDRGKDKGYER